MQAMYKKLLPEFPIEEKEVPAESLLVKELIDQVQTKPNSPKRDEASASAFNIGDNNSPEDNDPIIDTVSIEDENDTNIIQSKETSKDISTIAAKEYFIVMEQEQKNNQGCIDNKIAEQRKPNEDVVEDKSTEHNEKISENPSSKNFSFQNNQHTPNLSDVGPQVSRMDVR